MDRGIKLIFCIVCLLLGLVEGCSELEKLARKHQRKQRVDAMFTYAEQDKWKDQFPSFCAGMQQSPIDIQLGNCTQLPVDSGDLSFLGWNTMPTKTTLRKTKETVQIWNEYSKSKPAITGGPLGSGVFEFFQAHFHWGATQFEGSEHLLEGQQFAMEVHIIFLNQKYHTVDEAFLHPDGVSVIGRFYEVTPHARTPVFYKYLKNLRNESEVVANNSIPLYDISQNVNFDYVSYKGSLTAPICREVVTWIVGIDKNLEISDWKIDRFRQLVEEPNVFRAIQPLNERSLTCRLK